MTIGPGPNSLEDFEREDGHGDKPGEPMATPLTDEEVEIAKRFPHTEHGLWVSAEFARDLERQLREAHKEVAHLLTTPGFVLDDTTAGPVRYMRSAGMAFIDRGNAVNLARNWLDKNYPPLTPKGITTLAEAVMAMDNALAAHRLSKTEEADLRPAECITITQTPGELATASDADTLGSGVTGRKDGLSTQSASEALSKALGDAEVWRSAHDQQKARAEAAEVNARRYEWVKAHWDDLTGNTARDPGKWLEETIDAAMNATMGPADSRANLSKEKT